LGVCFQNRWQVERKTPNVERRTPNIEGRMKFRNFFGAAFVATIAVASSLIMGSAHAVAAESHSKDAAEIRAVMAAQVLAWNRGDIDGFMNGYARAETTEFVSGDKLTRGWQTVRDRYKKKYDSREKMGTLTFSELKITPLSSDAALVIGRWKLVRKTDKPQGRFTLLFRRTSAGWRIVHDHTS
jgi:beta-aspartyl-peptidase (threonine type)